MPPTEEPPAFPALVKYADGEASKDPEGYSWLVLPDVPSFAAVFGGGAAESRALMCERCGALVGTTAVHDQWHEKQDDLPRGQHGPTADYH